MLFLERELSTDLPYFHGSIKSGGEPIFREAMR